MTRITRFGISLLFVLAIFGCGKNPNKPTPNGGGEQPLPPNIFPENAREVYVSPAGGFVRRGDYSIPIPDNCFKIEVSEIKPGRRSVLPDGYEVYIDFTESICSEAPNVMNWGSGYKFNYDIADEQGNKLDSPWLSGSAGGLMPGQSQQVHWGWRVYEAAQVPPRVANLRARYVVLARDGSFSDFIFGPDGQHLAVLIPLNWHRPGA